MMRVEISQKVAEEIKKKNPSTLRAADLIWKEVEGMRLINQIEALKKTEKIDNYYDFNQGYNQAIDEVLNVIKEHDSDEGLRLLQKGVETGRKGGYVARTG